MLRGRNVTTIFIIGSFCINAFMVLWEILWVLASVRPCKYIYLFIIKAVLHLKILNKSIFLLNFVIRYVILNLKETSLDQKFKKFKIIWLKKLTIFKMTKKLIFLFFCLCYRFMIYVGKWCLLVCDFKYKNTLLKNH